MLHGIYAAHRDTASSPRRLEELEVEEWTCDWDTGHPEDLLSLKQVTRSFKIGLVIDSHFYSHFDFDPLQLQEFIDTMFTDINETISFLLRPLPLQHATQIDRTYVERERGYFFFTTYTNTECFLLEVCFLLSHA